MQYISVKGDVIKVNPYTIQLLHRVKCIWFKRQIQAMVFFQGWCLSEGGVYSREAYMTVFAQHPEAIIQGWLL